MSDKAKSIASKKTFGQDERLKEVSKLRLLTYTKLLFAIKTLERAGDHIENIAEEIHFIVTGEHIDLKRDSSDNKLEDAIEESNK